MILPRLYGGGLVLKDFILVYFDLMFLVLCFVFPIGSLKFIVQHRII
jgi:hypothetical protein